MDAIIEFLRLRVLPIVKVPAQIIPIAAIVLTAAFYILGTKSYVKIPGNDLVFELQTFQNCEITFKDPVYISYYAISKGRNSEHPGQSDQTALAPTDIHAEVSVVTVTNPFPSGVPDPNMGHGYTVQIFFNSSFGCNIEGVVVDSTQISMQSFLKNDVKVENAQFVKFRYVRNEIANVLTAYNDDVSNWILTILFVGIIALSFEAGKMELRTFYSDEKFQQFLVRSLKLGDISGPKDWDEAFDIYAANWHKINLRLRFLQALGPAVGFILTVSSLIAALEPTLAAGSDIDAFISGIHVAMVSTFLGLLLRILSLEASRVNDILLGRAKNILLERGE